MGTPAEPPGQAALRRVLRGAGGEQLIGVLADELSGADLTTLLLEVLRRRALALNAPDVLRRYRTDRFVAPASVGYAALRRAETGMIAALPDDFEVLTLAPVLPLGAHSAVAAVDQRNVIGTIRGTEVAADPTNGLALEAAVRRRLLLDGDPRSAEQVSLAATQRVTRAQAFSGPVSFAHFQLLGMITAGRDTGSRRFERSALAGHLKAGARGLRALGIEHIQIALTCLDELSGDVLAETKAELAGMDGVQVIEDPHRTSGRAYYRGLCFKVFGTAGESVLEFGDGGFVDWTAKLLGNRKERLLISGYGLDRVATMITDDDLT